jgi:hypothetical protein
MHCFRVRKSQLFFVFEFRFSNPQFFFRQLTHFFLIFEFKIQNRNSNSRLKVFEVTRLDEQTSENKVRFPEQVKADSCTGVVMSVQMVAAPAAAAEPNDDSSSELN